MKLTDDQQRLLERACPQARNVLDDLRIGRRPIVLVNVEAACCKLVATLEALRDLLGWEAEQGNWEAPCWDRARAALGQNVPIIDVLDAEDDDEGGC